MNTTLPEAAETPVSKRAWRSEAWGPLLLFSIHGAATLLLDSIGSPTRFNWGVAFTGGMFCQPLLCAVWASWAPYPLAWRFPLAAAACAFLALLSSVQDGEMTGIVVYGGVFLVFFGGLLFLRWASGWSLVSVVNTAGQSPINQSNRFTIRYLIGSTTVVALLISLGKFITYGRGVLDSGSRSEIVGSEIVGSVLAMTGVFGLLLIPVLGIGVIALGRARRLVAGAIVFPICGVVSSCCSVMLLRWIDPTATGISFGEMWLDFGMFTAGSMVTMLLSALFLRLMGYRLDRGAFGA